MPRIQVQRKTLDDLKKQQNFLWNSVMFCSVLNLGMDYSETNRILRKEHFVPRNNENRSESIFSEWTFDGNPNLSMWETIGTDVSWSMYERQWPGWWWLNGAEETHTSLCSLSLDISFQIFFILLGSAAPVILVISFDIYFLYS
jgi:hypothetical protein